MSEMVERAAREAFEWFRNNFWSDPTLPWERQNETAREPWIAAQRSAIAAMREPTEAMLAEADLILPDNPWKEMIDEALK